jgi:hypothetical protein
MVPRSLKNNRIFEGHHAGGKENHGEILAGRQRALAEDMVAPWRHVLQKMGVKATVKVYTGSLSSVVENHSREDGISLVMRDHPRHQYVGNFL